MNAKTIFALCAVLVVGCLGLVSAQQAGTYWVEKTKGGVYVPPNKPITHLADLKAKHAGERVWKELVVKDVEMQAEYNSAVPGTRQSPRHHPDTGKFIFVVAGELHFSIEGREPITAVRGSIVNIMKSTVFSMEVAGAEPALWVDINPLNFKTLYPGDEPKPVATTPGADMIKVSFGRTPAPYVAPNVPHWNLFQAASTGCQAGVRVLNDHLYANPLYGFADPNDPLNRNPSCGTSNGARGAGAATAGGRGRGGAPAADPPFNPQSTFGHMHAGPAEWWIVQVGQITGRFENIGEVLGVEGDILYAAPMTWHQMGFRGPGPSCRLAMGAYPLINMNSIPDR